MGLGFDELQKENRRYKTDKKATDGREKKSSRDWGKGNWIGETDKEKS